MKYQGTLMKSFGYDDRSNLISASYSPIGQTLNLDYDLNNRLTGVTDSNGRSVHYEYNAINARKLMTTSSPDGRSLTYAYEERNRLARIISTPGPTLMISYDDPQRRMTVGYPNGTSREYSYNKAGFLTSLVNKRGPEVISSYSYILDDMHNRINMTDLSGLHEYLYDDIYQLKQATDPISPPD